MTKQAAKQAARQAATESEPSTARLEKVLVFGLAATGRAVAAALRSRGHTVILADDAAAVSKASTASADATAAHLAPDEAELRRLVGEVDAVSPSPGVPGHHPIYKLAQELKRPILGDFDLAARWDNRPIAAITGTNGKTTVTVLATAMLVRSGVAAVAAGNTELPLVAAIDQPSGTDATTAEAFVVEASSFRLAAAQNFAPKVGAWLNLTPDHLDWHGDMAAYESAKARIWRNADQAADQTTAQDTGQPAVAVYPHADSQIAKHVPAAAKPVTFASAQCLTAGDLAVSDDNLCAYGRVIVPVAQMALNRPHDIANAAAAAAVALEMGANDTAIAAELAEFEGLAHRLKKIAVAGDVAFYDDSKATTPAAVLAGVAGLENAVLIAGGRNKGLSLKPLSALASQLLAVVVIGEAAEEIADIFKGHCRVERANNMRAAVEQAAELAAELAGQSVVLSPACASFDWYDSYNERGDDFAAEVFRLTQSSRQAEHHDQHRSESGN